MTTLLAIESSTDLASVALLHQGQLISLELDSVATHSAGILPAVQQLLAQADLSLKHCDALAFGCGPGAFTGLRTATGIVQGLAFAAELAVIPIITLHAMALAAQNQRNQTGDTAGDTDFLCLLDARMNEVYSAVYRYQTNQQSWQELQAPRLSALNQVEPAQANVLVCGRGVELEKPADTHLVCQMPHAREIALLAQIEWLAGRFLRPEQAQPLYLRNKIALTTQERLQQHKSQ